MRRSRATLGAALSIALLAPVVGAAAEDPPALSLDGFNQWAHSVNQAFVENAVSPVLARVDHLPGHVKRSLGNAFSNLSEPVSALSHLMVGDGGAAARSTARFTVNSTLGLLGTVDAAKRMGLPENKRHFSEGVCALGLATEDLYVVVPAVGPSTAGIVGSALFVMVGSTVALSFVSTQLALASVVADLAGSAAALESAAASAGGARDRAHDERAFRQYLGGIGCAGPRKDGQEAVASPAGRPVLPPLPPT